MSAHKKYKNKVERLAAKKKYYDKNKHWLNANRREKRRIAREKKPISKFKNCTSCGKRLAKTEKNFRYISKKNNVLRFRSVCRDCEKILNAKYAKTSAGKIVKSKANKKYAVSGRKKISQKKYYDKNKKILNKKNIKRRAVRRKTDPHTKIRDNLSLRMRLALKEQNLTKRNTTHKLVGCSIKFLKKYLENQFYPHPKTGVKMTWMNYSRKGWHIDHIKPCASFDLSNPKQQIKCFNYKNLQPLWAEENIKKSNK